MIYQCIIGAIEIIFTGALMYCHFHRQMPIQMNKRNFMVKNALWRKYYRQYISALPFTSDHGDANDEKL